MIFTTSKRDALVRFYNSNMKQPRDAGFKLGVLLVTLGLGGLFYGGFLWFHQSAPSRANKPGVAVEAAPSAAKPTQESVDSYQVPADHPKYISIPAIAVTKTRVLSLGLRHDGAIATPDNIFDAGWYNTSAKPGQPGVAFIFGHVSSWQARGVFYDLKKLSRGEKITITDGNNQVFTYQVDGSQTFPYDQVDMQKVLTPDSPNASTLRLMTCTGSVIRGTNNFSERLVVSAHLLRS